MQGQTDEENLYRFERRLRYSDSINIIRKQIETYEKLMKEQTERMEAAIRENKEAERLQREVELVRKRK